MTVAAAEITRFAQSLDLSPESINAFFFVLLDAFDLKRPHPSAAPRAGKLITFDGHAGSGKDTQIEWLARRLAACSASEVGHREVARVVLKQSNPFRSVAKFIWANDHSDAAVRNSFLVLSAGRRYVVEAVVLPLLADAQNVVLQNRSYLSHVAYHAGPAGSITDLLRLCDFDPTPDLSLVLTCETDVACARIKQRAAETGGMIYPNETPEFIDRTNEQFRQLAVAVDGLVAVDTRADIETVANEIWQHVDGCLVG